MSKDYANVDEGRAAAAAAHSEWWAAYMKDPQAEATTAADEKSKAIRSAVLAKFGTRSRKYPDCEQCFSESVFGGPAHEASVRCRSGRHPHCTCDTCF